MCGLSPISKTDSVPAGDFAQGTAKRSKVLWSTLEFVSFSALLGRVGLRL